LPVGERRGSALGETLGGTPVAAPRLGEARLEVVLAKEGLEDRLRQAVRLQIAGALDVQRSLAKAARRHQPAHTQARAQDLGKSAHVKCRIRRVGKERAARRTAKEDVG